ncbi:MAG: NAD(P)H-binding protein [Chitinophagaceae bacterium]|nr:NAD(P)H-binding protein [Chitinophagaceae bacterium]
MKYVITGGAGNISKPLVLQLLKAGHAVTVTGRSAENLKELTDAGATAAVGTVEDLAFLTKIFKGADAVYTMVPPNWAAVQWKQWIGNAGENYAAAIRANGITHVVNLSSIGADLPDGCGPVSGLYKVEQALNASGAAVKHLRPSYFFSNFLGNAAMVKHMNIIGSNFGGDGFKLPMSSTDDIAAAAFEELTGLSFTGHSARYLVSDELGTSEIAGVLGSAVGKPELPWVSFTDEQAHGGMIQAGLNPEVAKNYVEMGAALRSGVMQADFIRSRPAQTGKVKFADFATVFAQVYQTV